MATLSIVSDVVCPWCYIGKHRLFQALDTVREKHPSAVITIDWLPFELNPELPPAGVPRDEYCERKFGTIARANRIYAEIAANAQADGLPIKLDRISTTPNTLSAHRLICYASRLGQANAVVDGLFRAYFVEGKNIGDKDTLIDIGYLVGLEANPIRKLLDEEVISNELIAQREQAYDSGAQGVPAFLWNGNWLFIGAQSPETIVQIIEQRLNQA
ncbi:MAG: DsbA family oxidoreductase [Pseudomonadota bacterium]